MTIIAKKPENENIQCPAGTFQAVCYGVWDLGQQKSVWNGVTTPKHKLVIAWEIDERIDQPDSKYHEKRFAVSKTYTVSLGTKSNLYKDLVAWRGKPFTSEELEGFDIETVLGANCLLQVVHTEGEDRTWVNVGAVMALPKSTQKLTPEIPSDPPQWVKDKQAKQYSINDAPDYDEPPPPDDDDLAF